MFAKNIKSETYFNDKIIQREVNQIPEDNIYFEEYGNLDYFLPGTLSKSNFWEIKLKPSKEKGILYAGSSCTIIGKAYKFKLNEKHVDVEKIPVNYNDYINKYGTLNDYIYTGGFKEYIETKNNDVLYNILYNSIQRLCIKYNIKSFNEIFDLSLYIVKNPCILLNKVKKLFNKNKIDLYINYLEKSNIIFKIEDINENDFRLYTIDNGFTNLGDKINKDVLIENIIAKKIITDYSNYNVFKDNDAFILKKGKKEIKKIKINENTLNDIFISN